MTDLLQITTQRQSTRISAAMKTENGETNERTAKKYLHPKVKSNSEVQGSDKS
jgi:hypothetical protein